MKEFMLLVHNVGNPIADLTEERRQEHITKITNYIKGLAESGNLLGAQPFESEGTFVSAENGSLLSSPLSFDHEVISGYYHIRAETLEDAIAIAKRDPRFEDGDWRIQVRPIMNIEGINE